MKHKFRTSDIVFSALVVITVTFLSWQNNIRPANTSPEGIQVVIDAGHGLPDGGAVGKSGVNESKINLKVSKIIEKELLDSNIRVLMTRVDENAVYTDENASVRDKKRDDLRQRVKLINESGAELAVSIHMNYFGIEKYSGPQLFCPAGNDKSKRAAVFIKNSIINDIGEHCTREIKEVTGGIFVLEKAAIPIVLAECGFLSNYEEEKLLLTDEYCAKMGKAIAKGIISYLNDLKT